jgi:beta-galactosidase/beta-glucuronidase
MESQHEGAGERLYPRPDFDRSGRWLSLDGPWGFAADPDDRGRAEGWERPGRAPKSGTITVPFAWETPASGIEAQWLPVGWYFRHIAPPGAWKGERTILHIGAAHYATDVWLDGRHVGTHAGGYLPFACDLTDALEHGDGKLVIRIEAPIDKRFIPHGKQRSRPADDYDGCSFTPSSGIWQSVWLEPRPATYINALQLRPSAGLAGIEAFVEVSGPKAAEASVTVEIPGQAPQVLVLVGSGCARTTLRVEAPRLWSPRSPHLYEVTARLRSPDGSDDVRSYTGLRSIAARAGHLYLNDERLYVRGVLDQGFWPRSGYTAPDDAALRRDVELILAAGYSLSRKHIKLEDPRWLYWADRLGLLVWEEPPCVGRFALEAQARFEAQLEPMVARDGNHPCIVFWGIYNEEWGLDFQTEQDPERRAAVVRAYDRLKAADPSRPIIDDSGWSHVKTDILDWHYYDNDIARWARITETLAGDSATALAHFVVEEVPYETPMSVSGVDHAGLPIINGEYGGGVTDAERGWHLRWQSQELRRHDVFDGYIYTEITDVEHELAGIYTADRCMKPLGCNLADVNAETLIVFDLIPERPGRDLVVHGRELALTMRISHQGSEPLLGALACAWETQETACSTCELAVAPHSLSSPVRVTCVLPDGMEAGKLLVTLQDQYGRPAARAFLDVVVEAGGAVPAHGVPAVAREIEDAARGPLAQVAEQQHAGHVDGPIRR